METVVSGFWFCFFFDFPALSMFGTTVGLYGIPWCKKSLLLTVLMSVIGAAMGILDTGKGPRGPTVPLLNQVGTSSSPKLLLEFHVTHLETKDRSCFTWPGFLNYSGPVTLVFVSL